MIVSQSKKRPVVWDRPSRIPIRRTTIISRTLAELSRPIIRPSFQTLTPQECYLVRQYAEFWRVWASDAQRIRLANEYHLSQTKHKVLMAWKTIAWHSKREWKLDLKAEIHFKYLLKAKVLASWLDFAYARRRTRQSKQQASVLRGCLFLSEIPKNQFKADNINPFTSNKAAVMSLTDGKPFFTNLSSFANDSWTLTSNTIFVSQFATSTFGSPTLFKHRGGKPCPTRASECVSSAWLE